jgi:putative ABC transport system ATP-binding protein
MTRKPEVILEAAKLKKVFPVGRGVVAVDDISLEVGRGEFVVVVGPSGCGKSTLLNLLGGLDRPTAGDVELDGQRFSALTEDGLAQLRRKKLGFVFQFFNLLNDLTARENVGLPMRLVGKSESDIAARTEELLSSVDIFNRADHFPSELSGGEQQRVAVARALANNPLLVLADEPTGNLDTDNSAEIVSLFRDFNSEFNQTFVVVSHDLTFSAYADRVIHMRDGEIERVEEGPSS